MDWELAFIAVLAVVIAVVWIDFFARCAVFRDVTAEGIHIHTLLAGKKLILWNTIRGSARRYSTFIPRVTIRVRSWHGLTRVFIVVLRGTDYESQLLERLGDRVGLAEARPFGRSVGR